MKYFFFPAALLLIFFSCETKTQQAPHSSPTVFRITTLASAIPTDQGNIVLQDWAKDNSTLIFLVRHAEKMDGSDTSDLTQRGKERARGIAELLSLVKLDAVYSTDFERTRETAKPCAEENELSIQIYNHKDLPNFAKALKENNKGKKILVVGHSNSTPSLVNELIGAQQYAQLAHEDYNYIFVFRMDEAGKSQSLKLQYN